MKGASSGYETQFHIRTQYIVTWGGGVGGGGGEVEGGKSMMMMMMMMVKYQMFILL